MVGGPLGLRHRIYAALLIAAPGVLGLCALAAAGLLAWLPALAMALAVLAVTSIIAVLHLANLERVLRRVRHLAEAERQPQAPAGRHPAPALLPPLEPAVAEVSEKVRRREEVLRAKLASNDALLSALPDPLILLDSQGQILRLNTAAQALFGKGKEGRDVTDVLRHPDLVRLVEGACGGALGGQVEFNLPGTVERAFHARVTPLAGAEEPAAVVTLHELTAIRRAERLRGDFVANASHELRTPLASLVGFIETLRGPAREDPTARDRFLSIMHEQAQRMSRLIEDLLSLSRIELEEHSPPDGRVDLVHVLRSTAGALEIQARKKQMRIRLDLEGLPKVIGNEDELNQLFQNLIDNAVKYGRPKTEVTVTARPVESGPSAPGVRVSVADEGEGIAREDIPRLTERFYRVDKARSRALGGTGLGLAIVKHIVNRHRGRLSIDSEPGRGSTFTIQLPATNPKPDSAAAGQSAAE